MSNRVWVTQVAKDMPWVVAYDIGGGGTYTTTMEHAEEFATKFFQAAAKARHLNNPEAVTKECAELRERVKALEATLAAVRGAVLEATR